MFKSSDNILKYSVEVLEINKGAPLLLSCFDFLQAEPLIIKSTQHRPFYSKIRKMCPVLFKNEVVLGTTTQAKQYTKMHYSGILLDIKILRIYGAQAIVMDLPLGGSTIVIKS